MMTMMFFKDKSDAFQLFKWYLARVEKEIRNNLKFLRSNIGSEFILNEFNKFCNDTRIKRWMSTPRTPPQNGIAGTRNI